MRFNSSPSHTRHSSLAYWKLLTYSWSGFASIEVGYQETSDLTVRKPIVVVEFVDTNVLLYLVSNDTRRINVTERLLGHSPHISVQVLNEMAAVLTRKVGLSIRESYEITKTISAHCTVVDVTQDDHELACSIVSRYEYSFYDALMIATALRCDARRLYTEDMQHGQIILRTLRIIDPFR